MHRVLRARLPATLAPELQELKLDIENAQELFKQYETSALVLEENPNDADAQTVAGKFLCLSKTAGTTLALLSKRIG